MAMTKFTIVYGNGSESYYTAPEHDKRTSTIEQGIKEAAWFGTRLTTIALLISFIKNYPDTDIKQAIGAHFAGEKIYVTKKGKNKTQYWIQSLYIHVEG